MTPPPFPDTRKKRVEFSPVLTSISPPEMAKSFGPEPSHTNWDSETGR